MKFEFAIHTLGSTNGVLRFAARVCLDGSSNYIAWKDKMEAMLEDNGLKEFIDQDIPKSPISDA